MNAKWFLASWQFHWGAHMLKHLCCGVISPLDACHMRARLKARMPSTEVVGRNRSHPIEIEVDRKPTNRIEMNICRVVRKPFRFASISIVAQVQWSFSDRTVGNRMEFKWNGKIACNRRPENRVSCRTHADVDDDDDNDDDGSGGAGSSGAAGGADNDDDVILQLLSSKAFTVDSRSRQLHHFIAASTSACLPCCFHSNCHHACRHPFHDKWTVHMPVALTNNIRLVDLLTT